MGKACLDIASAAAKNTVDDARQRLARRKVEVLEHLRAAAVEPQDDLEDAVAVRGRLRACERG